MGEQVAKCFNPHTKADKQHINVEAGLGFRSQVPNSAQTVGVLVKIGSEELRPCSRRSGHIYKSFTLKEFPHCQPRWCQFFGCMTARFRSQGAQFSSNCCRCHGLSRFRRVMPQFRCISRPTRAMSPSRPCHLEVWCSEKVMGLKAFRRVDFCTQGKQSTLCVIPGFVAVRTEAGSSVESRQVCVTSACRR